MSAKTKARLKKYNETHNVEINTNRRVQEVMFDENGVPYVADQTSPAEFEEKALTDMPIFDVDASISGPVSSEVITTKFKYEDDFDPELVEKDRNGKYHFKAPPVNPLWKINPDTGEIYTELKPNTKVPNHLSILDRVRWCAKNGYQFTNCDVTETLDNPIPKNTKIYPVFQLDIRANSLSALYAEHAYSYYFSAEYILNLYNYRMGGIYLGDINNGQLDRNRFKYGWYYNNPATLQKLDKLAEPVREIEITELDGTKDANNSLTLKLETEVALLLLASGLLGAGALYLTADIKLALLLSGGLLIGGGAAIVAFNADEIATSIGTHIFKSEIEKALN